MFFWSKRKEERRRRLVVSAFVENELENLVQRFSKARLKVRHEKEQDVFLVNQERGEGEEDLYSFVWMKIIWGSGEKVEFSTREIHPEIRICTTSDVYDAILYIGAFLKKYNSSNAIGLVVGE
jgi:hypothetical protein